MEIITGVERRRRWRLEEKLRIVAEDEQSGASFVDVARRHEVSRGLLWSWRVQVRRSELVPEPMPTFLPVQVTADGPAVAPAPVRQSRRERQTLPHDPPNTHPSSLWFTGYDTAGQHLRLSLFVQGHRHVVEDDAGSVAYRVS